MHELYELKDKLMKELEEYGTQELTAGSLEVVDKLSHAIKNICKIIETYEEEEEGYSMRGRSYDDGMTNGGSGGSYRGRTSRNYEGGNYRYSRNSYARGRGVNARRDSMGRYSRAEGVEELVENVREMMGELPQNLQMDAQKFVQKLEQEMM